MERYPVPTEPPRYVEPPRKVDGRGRVPLYEVVAALFVVLSLGFAVWLAILLIARPPRTASLTVLNLVLFWLVLTYITLPRLHQIFTFLYVPDYFIGRTRTGDGLLGDPINLALDGAEDDIHAAMLRAGWTRADPITLRSSLGIISSALLRRPYPAAPVSDLLLFGRPQDFAYQLEVDGNASKRHHVRFWRVPDGWLLPGGHRVDWLAGATYDRAVGLSLFTLQVTHKIDADIDIERDFLIDSVRYADPDVGVRVIKDFSTAYHARNGGGDALRTDGDLPILDAAGAASRPGAPRVAAEAASTQSDHAVPPKGLLFTGVLVGLVLLNTIVTWVVDGPDPVNLVATIVIAACWGLTMARSRWAWVVLMLGSSAATAETLLAATFGTDDIAASVLLAGLALLVVLAVSGEDVRAWVAKGRREPQLDTRTGQITRS